MINFEIINFFYYTPARNPSRDLAKLDVLHVPSPSALHILQNNSPLCCVQHLQLSLSPAKPSSLSEGPRIPQKFIEEFNCRHQNPHVISFINNL